MLSAAYSVIVSTANHLISSANDSSVYTSTAITSMSSSMSRSNSSRMEDHSEDNIRAKPPLLVPPLPPHRSFVSW